MTNQQQLDALAQQIIETNIAPELAAQATQLVMGEGSPDAEVVFIGEAPGATEDKLGKTVCGCGWKVSG